MTSNRIPFEKAYTYGELLKKRRVNFENNDLLPKLRSQIQSPLNSSRSNQMSKSIYSDLSKDDLHKKIIGI